jgi:acyl carrier protein phosphodiesterase
MNFLAHALLAGDHPALVVGGVVGDWIKGPLPGSLPDDLSKGVALHRAIDSFAETHPAFRASRNRISPTRRRYAGILVDVFYDHLLARDWLEHHEQPLTEFSRKVYRMIDDRMRHLPEASHPALRLMASEDWLSSYADIKGITDILVRMSRRAQQPNPLAGGEQELLADIEGFGQDFDDWLRDAQRFVRQWYETNC